MHIGEIIKHKRKEKKMKLIELAAKSGVAVATLSRIEHGKMTGTLESHMSIARALELTLADLYRDLPFDKKTLEMKPSSARSEVLVHDKSIISEMLVSKTTGKKMLPLLVTITEGSATKKETAKIGVEKFVYVLSGRVEAVLGNESYHLGKGDTIYFDGSVPHVFKNTASGNSQILCLTCPV